MGITYADLRLANDARDDLEEIDASAVVDTGALHLCIPEHVALQLQLKTRSQREVQTADGKSHRVDYVSPVRISMLGRECVTGALVIGNQVLAWRNSAGRYGFDYRAGQIARDGESAKPEYTVVAGKGNFMKPFPPELRALT